MDHNDIVCTPKPGVSAMEKRLTQRNFGKQLANIQLSPVRHEDSLGVVSIESASTIEGQMAREKTSMDVESRLESVRRSAYKTLESRHELPPHYFKPSEKTSVDFASSSTSGSTISDSDFLRETPAKSTRDSYSIGSKDISQLVSSNGDSLRSYNPQERMSYSKDIGELSKMLRNTDLSIRELRDRFSMSKQQYSSSSISSDMFVPAEQAAEKMLQHEMSWRKAKGLPIVNDSRASNFSEMSTRDIGKCSMGEFFNRKNPEMTGIFNNRSPEKCHPEPLYESMSMSNIPERESDVLGDLTLREKSMLTVAEIRKLLSNDQFDSPKIIDYLINKQRKNKAEPRASSTSSKLTEEFEPPHYSTFTETDSKPEKQTVEMMKLTPIPVEKNRRSMGEYKSPKPKNLNEKYGDKSPLPNRRSSSRVHYSMQNSERPSTERQSMQSEKPSRDVDKPEKLYSEANSRLSMNASSQRNGRLSPTPEIKLSNDQPTNRAKERSPSPHYQNRNGHQLGKSPTNGNYLSERNRDSPRYENSPNLSNKQPQINSKTYISPTMGSEANSTCKTGSSKDTFNSLLKGSPGEFGSNKENEHYFSMPKSSSHLTVKPSTPESEGDRSMSSVRSGSSLDTLAGGKIPISTSKNELIWGCVKVGKSVVQKFLLRSKSHKKVRFQISVTGNAFKIQKTETEHMTSFTTLLHPLETKSFTVIFSPTEIGSFAEKLNFTPVGVTESQGKQNIRLYGYGGQSSIEVRNITKDLSGKAWLSLGIFDNKQVISTEIHLQNNGTVPAFSLLQFIPKFEYKCSVEVIPSKLVLQPNEEARVTVQYTPSKEDFNGKTDFEILEVGHLRMITGNEPTRFRLKRLCRKAKQAQSMVDSLVEELSTPFVNEVSLDLVKFTESVGAIKELLHQLNFKEVIVTLEQDMNKTVVPVDETTMFETICMNSSNTLLESTVINKVANLCTVMPSILILTPPLKKMDTIILSSSSSKPLPFHIVVDSPQDLQIYPSKGVVSCETTAVITVSYQTSTQPRRDYLIKIMVEKELLEVKAKVMYIDREGFKY